MGEKNLKKLLSSIAPQLMEDEYVFCSFDNSRYGDYAELEPLASFAEGEGLTLVVLKSRADKYSHSYESVFKCITLSVHSNLDAVGLTATVATKLAGHGISANIIAAYYHDHVFVQAQRAEEALVLLSELAHQ